MPRTAIHWQREELSVEYPPSLDDTDARAIVVACLESGKVPPPTERRRWGGVIQTTAGGRFTVTFVRDIVTITPEGEEGLE